MQMFSFVAIFCIFVLANSVNSEFPPEITKCHYAETKCLSSSIQEVIRNYAKSGLRGLNLIPFSPLHINSLKLEKNPSSPVSIELRFKEIDLFGLQEANVLKVKGFDADMKETIEVEVTVPKLTLKGPYEIDGRVLILPIVGKGASEIRLENTHITIKVKAKPMTKNGQTYFVADAIKLDLKPSHVHFELGGLFNGMKELADNMHVFINENWQEIFTELQPDISRALALVIKHIVNNVFSKFPYSEYFAEN